MPDEQNQILPLPLDERLAAIAHERWCARMRAEGWRHGPQFSEPDRTHDALVPFDQLARADRRAILVAMRAEKAAEWLGSLVEYGRGPDRRLTVEEMRKGLRLALATDQHADPPETGIVESWEVDPADGEVVLVKVRWPDGELTEHIPELCEPRRV